MTEEIKEVNDPMNGDIEVQDGTMNAEDTVDHGREQILVAKELCDTCLKAVQEKNREPSRERRIKLGLYR